MRQGAPATTVVARASSAAQQAIPSAKGALVAEVSAVAGGYGVRVRISGLARYGGTCSADGSI